MSRLFVDIGKKYKLYSHLKDSVIMSNPLNEEEYK
jgi:hypothetical protein